MDVRKYLSKLKIIDGQINSKIEQKRQVLALATCVTNDTTREKTGTNTASDHILNCIEKLDMLEREINRDIDQLVDLKIEISNVIKSLNNPTEKLVLELIYLCGKTVVEVADDMNYSERHIERIHKKALLSIEEAIENNIFKY
jgi:RNA polymerase sigma factor (sigma-70 family)